MADIPYTTTPTALGKFLEQIPKIGIPPRVTAQYLTSLGLKGSNDRTIIPVLKSLGLVDGSGAPTPVWQRYRNKDQSQKVLASAIRAAYSDLFGTFPDAHRKDNEALRNYISSRTPIGESALAFAVRTFRVLCGFGDFSSGDAVEPLGSAVAGAPADLAVAGGVHNGASHGAITVNVNIQLQLPATDEASIYDKLFASMRQHLLS